MPSEHETSEQRRKRLKKAKEHIDRLEQGHLNDQPEPISKRLHGTPLSSEPPMDLIK
jgi:hypothetical protein